MRHRGGGAGQGALGALIAPGSRIKNGREGGGTNDYSAGPWRGPAKIVLYSIIKCINQTLPTYIHSVVVASALLLLLTKR